MFYFIMKIIFYLLMIIIIYHYYSKNRINILNFLIILFLLNIYFLLLYNDISILIGVLITLLVFTIERLYNYLYLRNSNNFNKDKVLIKNGNINFNNLINNKYSYNKLINCIKRKGIKDLSKIDYCVLYKNDLIVFSDNINNYPVNLIIDGKVINNNLNSLKKDRNWLNNCLKENDLLIKDVSYAFYKDNQIYFLTNV